MERTPHLAENDEDTGVRGAPTQRQSAERTDANREFLLMQLRALRDMIQAGELHFDTNGPLGSADLVAFKQALSRYEPVYEELKARRGVEKQQEKSLDLPDGPAMQSMVEASYGEVRRILADILGPSFGKAEQAMLPLALGYEEGRKDSQHVRGETAMTYFGKPDATHDWILVAEGNVRLYATLLIAQGIRPEDAIPLAVGREVAHEFGHRVQAVRRGGRTPAELLQAVDHVEQRGQQLGGNLGLESGRVVSERFAESMASHAVTGLLERMEYDDATKHRATRALVNSDSRAVIVGYQDIVRALGDRGLTQRDLASLLISTRNTSPLADAFAQDIDLSDAGYFLPAYDPDQLRHLLAA